MSRELDEAREALAYLLSGGSLLGAQHLLRTHGLTILASLDAAAEREREARAQGAREAFDLGEAMGKGHIVLETKQELVDRVLGTGAKADATKGGSEG